MHTKFSTSHIQDPGNNQSPENNPEHSVHLPFHETNTSEGSEFLDDALRMEDLQLGNTDEPTDEISLYVSQPFNEPADEWPHSIIQ